MGLINSIKAVRPPHSPTSAPKKRFESPSVNLVCRFKKSFKKMSFIGKKYKLEKSENFDEYMKELGESLKYILYITVKKVFEEMGGRE